MKLNNEQVLFLEDTRDILIDYDGYRSAENLMKLIDETRNRLSQLINELRNSKSDKVKIILNATEIEVGCSNLSYDQICELTGYSSDIVLSIAYSRGRNRNSKMLMRGQSV